MEIEIEQTRLGFDAVAYLVACHEYTMLRNLGWDRMREFKELAELEDAQAAGNA